MPRIKVPVVEKNPIIWQDRKRPFLGLPWSFTVYSLTEERFLCKTGFFNTHENEIRLYRILDMEFTQTLGQKIFGVGTIKVDSSDKTSGNFEIKNIKQPREVKELLSNLVEKQREAKRITGREFMGGPDFSNDDMMDVNDAN